MSGDRQQRTQDIFDAARQLPAADRAAYVRDQCGDDTDLEQAVLDLLEHHDRAQAFFAPSELPADGAGAAEHHPQTIGPFRIIELLGQGGMGSVYLAEQDEPIKRQVAVKVIRPGLASRHVLSRFQSEQQALAQLDHPSIARVLDAGTTDDDRPYFVMEYVDGHPITEYCDVNNKTYEERIAILLQVCHAVQHAHQKGIIHRDIKPSNVLVTEHDGRAVPKVIDFGVAKATDPAGRAATTLTHEGQLIGTLEYMSPEQARAADIDTRTDVYALGLLLYELLVGAPPFDVQHLRGRGLDEMIRVIRDDDPPRPSARISTLGDSATPHAARLGMAPRSLARSLRGDLDWIVMKALEKKRERRYESPARFAEDLQRFLQNEPVEARPPSTLYRLQRFTRRHRVGVAITSLIIGGLLTVTIVTAWQSARVARERDRANQESQISNEVANYLGELFHGAATAYGYADSVSLMEAMSMGISKLAEADMSPEAHIRLLRVFGNGLSANTKLELAQPVVTELVQRTDRHYGTDHIESARSRFLLMSIERQLGNMVNAIEVGERALPVFERELGPDDPQTLRCVWFLAGVHTLGGDAATAVAYYARLEDAYIREHGADHQRVGMLYNEMTFALINRGDLQEAERIALRSVEILEAKYGSESLMLMLSLDALSRVYKNLERYDEAIAVLGRSESIAIASYGANHAEVKRMNAARGWILLSQGDQLAAVEAFEAAIRILPGTPEIHKADPLVGLGAAQRGLGQLYASRRSIEAGLELLQIAFGRSSRHVASALSQLGETELAAGSHARADSILNAAVVMARAEFPEGHAATAACELALGRCLLASGAFEEAEPYVLAAHKTLTAKYPAGSDHRRRAADVAVELYDTWGKPDEAARFK